jgi:uracil-DNA glycosylase family 4
MTVSDSHDCLEGCPRAQEKINSPKLWGTGPDKAPIMLIGEAPGQDEDEEGIPFVGASGRLLNTILAEVGIDRKDVYITNAVKCATADENQKPPAKVINKCKKHVLEEISSINPKVIVCLGATALQSVLKRTGITKLQNNVLFSEELRCKVIPVVHPAYVLRNPAAYEDLARGLKLAKEEGVSRKLVARTKLKTFHKNASTVKQIDQLLDKLEASDHFVCDLETTSLDHRTAKIICFAFSWAEGLGITVFKEDLSDKQLERIKALFLSDKLKINHNIPFDIQILLANGIRVADPVFDTITAIALVDENIRDKGLDGLVLRYTDMGEYWAPLEQRKKEIIKEKVITEDDFSYDMFSRDEIGPYAQCDADATYRIYTICCREMDRQGLSEFYQKYTQPTAKVLLEMEYRGILVDRKKLKKLQAEYTKKVEDALLEVNKDPDVATYSADSYKKASEVVTAAWNKSKTLKSRYLSVEDYIAFKVKKEECVSCLHLSKLPLNKIVQMKSH